MAQDVAVVVASGRSVWTDLRAVRHLEPFAWFAVNDMVTYSPHVHHAVSHHPDKLALWDALRTHSEGRGRREPQIVTHSSAPGPGIARAWPEFKRGGSSSLLAVRIALALGHPHVIIAGVPLDDQGYVWSDPEAPRWYDFGRYRIAWAEARNELIGRVTAVSGYLRDLLGAPELALTEAVA